MNNEFQKLLKDGIIKPSRSFYNSPTWVFDKKGTDAFGKPNKRLVTDFRKLNERTIPDRYPMPPHDSGESGQGKILHYP